ncbi:cryptochrome/photolyase family protein [Ferruginibacter sp. SUN106]|uniref:cryptochrome/photolyase family protein n=1 Tax=Ferruginibacter sp. SUN106 TaxID=2978348 RepID=UPI003D36EB98
MTEVTLIFPHQLFKAHPAVTPARKVYLVEEYLFFNQYRFHQQKLLLHRAAMKCFASYLVNKKIIVEYIDATTEISDVQKLISCLQQQKITGIHFADVADNWLKKRIVESCKQKGIGYIEHTTPNFLNNLTDVKTYFDKKKTYFQTGFYTWQRKKRDILLDAAGGPEGGQWTYDADNRMKFPKKEKAPAIAFENENAFVTEARGYVEKNFPGNYGSANKFIYPTNFASAEKWLADFLQQRFSKFGIYEDAIVAKENFLHHSVLSPLINIGLLEPGQIITASIAAAAENNVPLNSLEGFIRQILGWREFIRIVYEREGSKQRTKNYWGFSRKIPPCFWTGTTGIIPIDNVIQKVLATGYCHHIERLMVLGNFMLLCEFDPDEVYRWFMEMFVDAYDWVMVPNVYGMTQFADGGLMTTKPYISGSNYLLKMSDYDKGDWTKTWDALFWRFMHVHRSFFLKNPRLAMLIKTFDKMPEEKQNTHLSVAEKYLNSL